MRGMQVRDRLVIVRVGALDDLCALALQAADDLELRLEIDPLATALRGAAAEIRVHALADPAE